MVRDSSNDDLPKRKVFLSFRVIDGSEQVLRWPDPQDGPYDVTVDISRANDELRLVGISISTGDLEQPITKETLERLDPADLLTRVRELVREVSLPASDKISQWIEVTEQTKPALPATRRTKAETQALLRRVANLYQEAKAAGGIAAAQPARAIADILTAEGEPTKPNQASDMILRAREKGLLAPARENSAES